MTGPLAYPDDPRRQGPPLAGGRNLDLLLVP